MTLTSQTWFTLLFGLPKKVFSLSAVKFSTACEEEEIMELVKYILKHVLGPSGQLIEVLAKVKLCLMQFWFWTNCGISFPRVGKTRLCGGKILTKENMILWKIMSVFWRNKNNGSFWYGSYSAETVWCVSVHKDKSINKQTVGSHIFVLLADYSGRS